MFQKWGFLLTEIWVLLALAALLGLFVGWLIWGGRSAAPLNVQNTGDTDRLRVELAACTSRGRDLAARISGLERDLAAAEARATAAPVMPLPIMAAPVVAAPTMATVMAQPKGLTGARGGKADDLKLIKGVGPKLEILCNKLGFYHFDQIAAWTASEISWVDENLEGFKGRVTRDEWVVQARDLAAGKPPRPGGEN